MNISGNTENRLQYLIVSLLVVFSGSLIPFVFSDGYSVSLVLFLFLLVCLSPVFRGVKFPVDSLFYLLLMASFLLILLFFRGEFDNLKEYVGVVGRLIIAYLVTVMVGKRKFIEIYTDILVFYSAFSLIMFSVGLVFLDFILSLPISFNDAGTGYRHLYVYFYQGIDTWNFRNAGMFWEPGAYQVFLSLALVFEIYFVNKSSVRKAILIAAIASTVSTIGLLVLVILSFVRLFSMKPLKSYILFAFFISVLLVFDIFDTLLGNKLDGVNISGVDRIVGQLADIQLFLSAPIFGVGFSAYPESFKSAAYALGAFAPTSSNSFTGLLALNGFIYSLLLFLPMFAFFLRTSLKISDRVLMLAIYIMLLSSQGLFNQLLFILIMFYGIQSNMANQTQCLVDQSTLKEGRLSK